MGPERRTRLPDEALALAAGAGKAPPGGNSWVRRCVELAESLLAR